MRRIGFALLGVPILFAAAGGYHLVRKVSLGAAEGGGEYFDYITFDAAARRVYLSHGTEVKVLDADTDKIVGTITGTKRNHGVALVPEVGRGFITDGDAGEVVMFDLKTFEKVGRIKADRDADSILSDPASKRVFCFNGDAKHRDRDRSGRRHRSGHNASGRPARTSCGRRKGNDLRQSRG